MCTQQRIPSSDNLNTDYYYYLLFDKTIINNIILNV